MAIRLTTACSIRPREPTFGRYDARPMTRDLVLLVPGFLGFSRVGNFYYFAERILAVPSSETSSPIFSRPRWRSGLRDRLAAPRRHPSAERRVLQGHVRPRARLVWVTDRGAGEPGGEGASRGVGLVAGEGHPQLQEHDAGGSLRADGPLNDGVVNTARQLLDPAPSEQFGGLVIADHGDVLGHYDRRDALAAGHTNAGLFHSGAGFGDDEFFSLYQRVTER